MPASSACPPGGRPAASQPAAGAPTLVGAAKHSAPGASYSLIATLVPHLHAKKGMHVDCPELLQAPGKRQLGLDRATNKQPERHHEPPHCRLHTGERRACLRQRAVDAEPQPECTVGAERDAGKHVVPPDLPLQRRTSTFDVCTAKPPARAELNSAQLVDTLSSISNALDWGVR